MKKLKQILTLALLAGLSLNAAFAQETRKEAVKAIKDKAIKDARKEAKKYKKEGYTNLPGSLSLDKQLEEAMIMTMLRDEQGKKKYYAASQLAKAETFASAKQQAQQLCINDISSQIGSNVIGRIKSDVANSENLKDATSVTDVIGAYQNTISAKLGRVDPVVILQRVDKKTGLTFVYMTAFYDMSAADEMVKKDLRKDLKEKTQELQEEIDDLLGFN